ncbi:MAG: DNA polymerase III subunit gamma/tau [Bacilli bacterium]|nr:DNA polymerase III subunit gamma/tau [Bacilli bacterium]
MYQALYRKYRPKNFEEVAGQENIISTLENAFYNNKFSHAYIFSGPRGTGKTSVAKIVAKIVNCESKDSNKPCYKCVNCTQNNSDIIEIDAASNNGVDEIRELKNKVNLAPAYGKYKVYIIDEVHMLTISAFNALLKTLEEPPAHAIFILATTEIHKIPLTILSRCQVFEFKRLSIDSIRKKLYEIIELEKISIEDNAVSEIARLSEGGMRDAINLLDQVWSYAEDKITVLDVHEMNGTVSQQDINNIIEALFKGNLKFILEKLDYYYSGGKNLIKLANEVVFFLRNVLIFNKSEDFLESEGFDVSIYKKISTFAVEKDIFKIIYDLNNSVVEMKSSNNPKLLLELVFIKNISIGEKKEDVIETIPVEKAKIEPDSIDIKGSTKDSKEKNTLKNSISKKIRIENTLAQFDKHLLQDLKKKIISVKPLLINARYSQFVSIILDGNLKAASNEYLLFMYKKESDVFLFNGNVLIIEEIIEKSLLKKYRVISVDEKEWEIIKMEFNAKKKSYVYQKEELENIKDEESSLKLFESIVEYK